MQALLVLGYFLTLVVNGAQCLAAPTDTAPRPLDRSSIEESIQTPSPSTKPPEDIHLSYPLQSPSGTLPTAKSEKPHVPGPWTISTGLRNGVSTIRDHFEPTTTINLSYQQKNQTEIEGEFDTKARLRVSYAWLFPFSPLSKRRPFASLGLTQTLTANSLFADLVDFEKAKIRARFGMDELFDQSAGWTSQIEIAWGLIGPSYFWSFGRSF